MSAEASPKRDASRSMTLGSVSPLSAIVALFASARSHASRANFESPSACASLGRLEYS